MKNTYCVYLRINKIDGKKYVGQTCQIPEKRWKEGKGYKGCVHFFNAIIKYGWDSFDHMIIADNLNHEEARRHMSEAHLGLKLSKEATEKLSKSLKGRIPWNKGIKTGPRSEETKKKLSEANKGKKPSVTAIKASIEARKGKSPWNKRLTKETDERVAKYATTKLKNKIGE